MADVAGFFYPRTATGRASLLPAPPWYYSGDMLTVEYRTDPARVAELLPHPLAPAPDDPGAVALIWADWQSCGEAGEELLDPVRAQYAECLAVVRCAFGGRVYSRCVYIWVDSDVALARGLVQGYPKKLGSIHQTRPHPFGRAAPRIAPGGTFAGTLAAGGRRLAQAVVTLREEAPAPGFVNAHPMAHHRWMPSIEKGTPDSARRAGRVRQRQRRGGPALARRRHARAVRVADRGTRLARGPGDHRRLLPAGRRQLGRRPVPSLDRTSGQFIKFGAKRTCRAGLPRWHERCRAGEVWWRHGRRTARMPAARRDGGRHGRRRAVLAADGTDGGRHEWRRAA